MYPHGRQIESTARTALTRSRQGAEQVSRLRHLAAVSKLDPDFVEKFLAIVIHEVIRHHESVRRATTEGIFRDELR
jgi:chorismate mutase